MICPGADLKPAWSFGQKRSMITPCGMYMKPRRTGALVAAAAPPTALSAQPIVSISGSASAAPTPRNAVRRLIRNLLAIGGLSRAAKPAMGKRITRDNANDRRLHSIPVLRNHVGQLIGDDLIIPFGLAAEGISEHFTGQSAAK